MFHRFSTWWRALSVVLLGLATMTWPAAARAATTASFTLVHQDAGAALGRGGGGRFTVALNLTSADPGAEVQISLYPRLVTRSTLAPVLAGFSPGTSAVSTTGNVRLTCAGGREAFIVALFTRSPGPATSPCTARGARLRLPCRGSACDGVYPLSYSVTSAGVATTKWSLLAVRADAVSTPLRVAFLFSLDPSALTHATRSASVLAQLARHRAIPFALSADDVTLGTVVTSPAAAYAPWRRALTSALASPLHRAVVAPPAQIDFAGLAAAGLAGQVSGQLSLPAGLVRTLTGRYVDAPVVVGGHPSVRALAALATAGVREVVLGESALATAPSTTLGWGAPFHVAGVRGLLALATDQPLGQLATNATIEPARRAVLTLDTLAFLHFEAPNAPAARTVVLEAPVGGLTAAYVQDLLGALAPDPFVTPISLTPAFDNALVGTDGAPTTRALAPGSTPSWSALNVDSLTSLAHAVNSFARAVASPAEVTRLKVDLAACEVAGDANARQARINRATTVLDAQLGQFSVDTAAITLTGAGTALPVTVMSHAPYTVTVVVHLITDRISFPHGDAVPVSLDAPIKSLRVPTSNHRGSSLTLQVLVTTPDGQLTLARAAIQVRIAGTSAVGYVITILSLLVLALWWWRTTRRSSPGRHAR